MAYDRPVPAVATFWGDVICPFCYLAAAPLGRLRAEGAVEVRFRPFEIHPETPRAGVPLEAFGKAKIDALYRELSWLATDAGLPLLRPARLPSSRLALEAVEMARAAKGEAGALEYAGRALGACFKEGLDVGDEATLRGIASAMGIGRDWQDKAFLARAFGPAVDAARAQAHDQMVTAVPATLVNGHPLVGYKRYDELKRVLERVNR
jgi:predicted DsbA family dithiol-disulfide isomerase